MFYISEPIVFINKGEIMNQEEIIETLTKDFNITSILKDEPMKKHTTFKVGGIADIYIKVTTVEEVKSMMEFTSKNEIPLTIIGNGSNILVRDKGIRGIVLEIDIQKMKFEKQTDGMIITARGRSESYSSFDRVPKTFTHRT